MNPKINAESVREDVMNNTYKIHAISRCLRALGDTANIETSQETLTGLGIILDEIDQSFAATLEYVDSCASKEEAAAKSSEDGK